MTGSAPDGPPTLPPGLAPVRTPSGLEYIDISAGKGLAAATGTTRVLVRYEVWLAEGSPVESSRERGGPATIAPGSGEAIPALEEGVIGMKPGGKRRLIAPSDLAYGPLGHGERIPPYATLILDLEIECVERIP